MLLIAPLAWGAAAAGANLFSQILGTRSRRKQMEAVRRNQLAALRPYEASLAGYMTGPTQAEGNIIGQSMERGQEFQAMSGTAHGSAAPSQVAAIAAPILRDREREILDRQRDLAVQKQAIYADTEAPGYGAAVGGFLGDLGGALASEFGRKSSLEEIERLLMKGGGGLPRQGPPLSPEAESLFGFLQGYREVMGGSGTGAGGSAIRNQFKPPLLEYP